MCKKSSKKWQDSGKWGEITYSIEQGNNEGLFGLDGKTGVLTVARSLADTKGMY